MAHRKASGATTALAERDPREVDQAGRLIDTSATAKSPRRQAAAHTEMRALLKALEANLRRATECELRARLADAIMRLRGARR